MKEGKFTQSRSAASRTPRKPAATVRTRKRPAPQQAEAVPPRRSTDGPTVLTLEEREVLIARIAYFRAEARGFAPGHELDDWYAAEAEIEAQLAEDR